VQSRSSSGAQACADAISLHCFKSSAQACMHTLMQQIHIHSVCYVRAYLPVLTSVLVYMSTKVYTTWMPSAESRCR
jgi:hypothetical protein